MSIVGLALQIALVSLALPPAAEPAAPPPSGPAEVLSLFGIDSRQMQSLTDNKPLAESEQALMLKILYRVQRFDPLSIWRWTQRALPYDALLERPEEFRGEMYRVAGRVRKVEAARVPRELADRFGFDSYYLCTMLAGETQRPVLVITTHIPHAWPIGTPLDEPASAAGLFVKIDSSPTGQPRPIFLAQRIAWHPDRAEPSLRVNRGQALLGRLGVDVGLYDRVENRTPLGNADRELFYQMLAAVGQIDSGQLVAEADENLPALAAQWQEQLTSLSAEIDALAATRRRPADEDDPLAMERRLKTLQQQQKMLQAAIAQAAHGRFSVAPLFNDADQQAGQLVEIEGTARRAVKVLVGHPAGEATADNDTAERFHLNHYYELDVFTEDSQDNPLVFCVRQLPPGFPTGENLSETVRIAGFFFKTWAFATRRHAIDDDGRAPKRSQQLAPLLIGHAPRWITRPPAAHSYAGAIAGTVFALLLLSIWLVLWRFAKSDRQFRAKTIAKKFQPTGDSPPELNVGSDTARSSVPNERSRR